MINMKIIAAAIAAAFITCAPSNAQEFSFEYESWMLSSAQGRSAVLDRLERQIANFCDVYQARGALQREIASDCVERVTTQALTQMNDPRVLALHQQRQRQREITRRA